jgi:DNA-binding NtrC family response regulator
MDVCLPATTDVDDLAIIKGLYRRLPIIITATENNPDLESRVRKKGIFYYHVKSFGMDELLLAINNAMVRATQ